MRKLEWNRLLCLIGIAATICVLLTEILLHSAECTAGRCLSLSDIERSGYQYTRQLACNSLRDSQTLPVNVYSPATLLPENQDAVIWDDNTRENRNISENNLHLNTFSVEAVSAEEVEILQRIVEAEAGGEDDDGKLLVANVVLNRVKNEAFPDTIREVVFQKSKGVTQFSPVYNGRYDKVTISEKSMEAVERALNGEDISEGALYFAARKYADKEKMNWFDEKLTFLFSHGGHEFFK